jgi:hypothetical protein
MLFSFALQTATLTFPQRPNEVFARGTEEPVLEPTSRHMHSITSTKYQETKLPHHTFAFVHSIYRCSLRSIPKTILRKRNKEYASMPMITLCDGDDRKEARGTNMSTVLEVPPERPKFKPEMWLQTGCAKPGIQRPAMRGGMRYEHECVTSPLSDYG